METTSTPGILHVLNGDATARPLRRSGVPGTIAVWADVLHEGPIPADLDDPSWQQRRAEFLAAAGYASRDQALATYATWDAALAAYDRHGEVVIWLEHDLFDQLLLIRHLEWFGRRHLGGTRLSLICIGEFPGVEPFHGLGQLSPGQLGSLFDRRRPVDARQMDLGRRAWRAVTSDDPAAVQRIVDGDTSALPFLGGALRRLLEEYPAVRSGLPRTERHILEASSDRARTAREVFRAVQQLEDRVFMGDTTFRSRMRKLASGRRPLIEISTNGVADSASRPADHEEPLADLAVAITDTGRRVLAGEADWIEIEGIDKWIGGVRLSGRSVPWRWDPRAMRILPVRG